jgi:hypothetical protein
MGILRAMSRRLSLLLVLVSLAAAMCGVVVVGCGPEGAPSARVAIREVHAAEVREIARDDKRRHFVGVRKAAEKLAPGFLVEDPARREREVRFALKRLQQPPRGITEFIASPMSFLAAVGSDGKVIARDAQPDRMRGLNMGGRYPLVRTALSAGEEGYGLGEFADPDRPTDPPSISMLFVGPSRRDTNDDGTPEVVGAVVAGIPLWRMSQRMGMQLRLNHADQAGLILWVYLYKGDRLFHFDTPPDLDQVIPTAAQIQSGLRDHPRGYTGEVQQFGRWYGWGVVPLPSIAEDVGALIVRSDPT